MGNRLHVAKIYRVEYGDTTGFNYKNEELHDLLNALGVEYSGDSYDTDFEVSRLEWRKGISKLEKLDELDNDNKKKIENLLEVLGYDRDEVIKLFKKYDEESEPESFYLEFSFF